MSKVLAALIAGFFAVGAYAQGTSQEAAPPTNTPSQKRAEMKKDARKPGVVNQTAGDTTKVSEGSGGVTATAADKKAAERQATRSKRRLNKDGTEKMPIGQGGTPK
ncbi:conserved exported hypothetical protein [Burkholderiales bacterium 8X]|nr:conserved exported hypothetical protein [Burkholderiales bacterium 8X]